MTGMAAAQMGDINNLVELIENYETEYCENRKYPLYTGEAGWICMECEKLYRLYERKIKTGFILCAWLRGRRCLKWTCQKLWLLWDKPEVVVVKCGKKIECERECYAMYSSEKSSLAVGLSPYKIAKKDAFAGRLFSPFCMACSVHKFFTNN